MNGRVNRRDGAEAPAARLNRVEIDTNPAVLSPACAGRRRAPQRRRAIIAAALLALCVALGPGQPATGGATRPSVPVAANANGYRAFSVSRMAARAPVVGAALPSATTGQATDSVPASGPGSVAALAFAAPGDWHTPQLAQPLTAGPQISAKAAFAVDLTAGVELYADNADQPLPPASLTKIVTALVALRTVSLNDVVTIQASDTVDPAVYSHMGLEVGDQVTVRNLLAGMFLPSGDDAARALARYVGERLGGGGADPRAATVAAMNKLAAQLGMTEAHFVDTDGEDAPGHVISARDLAIATAALFQSPFLENLVAQQTMTVPVAGPHARSITLVNTNDLLGTPGVHGVKTGTTPAAGECLVLAIWRGNDRVVTVVLGSSHRYADTQALLSYLDSQYRWVQLGRGGDVGDLAVQLQAKGLVMVTGKTVLLTTQQASTLRYQLTVGATLPTTPWSPAGQVVFFAGNTELLRLPVYPRSTTPVP